MTNNYTISAVKYWTDWATVEEFEFDLEEIRRFDIQRRYGSGTYKWHIKPVYKDERYAQSVGSGVTVQEVVDLMVECPQKIGKISGYQKNFPAELAELMQSYTKKKENIKDEVMEKL